ncbi:CmNV_039-like protein [Aratus pisonii nudivirus]|nr:CmNV_039-like protein [Aratus pisonii nudivirus]
MIKEAFLKHDLVFTDIFNIFYKPEHLDTTLDSFDFIIDESDIVSMEIFKYFVKNINKNLPKKVYVNPKMQINEVLTLYTKPPPNTQISSKSCARIFKYPFHTLSVVDNNSNTNILNLQTMDVVSINKIWNFNPSLTDDQNTDILMQKLTGGNITINNDTYNKLINIINKYKTFKTLKINQSVNNNFFTCNKNNYQYTLYGYNLTEWP